MALFKLLAGIHIQADPNVILTPEQIKAGAKRPSKTYTEGSTVKSDDDLVAKHGATKFVLIKGTPKKSKPVAGTSVAPGGQVSSGFQEATGTPQGTVSGLMDDSEEGEDTPSDDSEESESKALPQTREEAERHLQRMNVVQLRAAAQSEGIDLHGKNTKAEIIAHMLAVKDD